MRYSYLPPRFVCLLFFSVFWVAPTVLAQEEARTWKLIDAEGIKGTISSFRDSQVTIRTEDGSKTVALDQLEPKDRKRALASRLGSGVVLLTASDAYRRPMSFGSGFIVSNEDKTIITNFHVVERAAEIAVAFRDGEVKSRVERCVAVDSANDLVLLQLDKMPFGLHEFQIADSANVEQGDEAWTIGHPQGLKDTVSWGEINAVRKTKDLPRQLAAMFSSAPNSKWLQTDAVISQGSSGGPLLNAVGQVVGLNTLLAGPNLGLAISSRSIHELLSKEPIALKLPLPPGRHQSAMDWSHPKVGFLMANFQMDARKIQRIKDRAEYIDKMLELRNKMANQLFNMAEKTDDDWCRLQATVYGCQYIEWDAQSEKRFIDLGRKIYVEHKNDAWLKDFVQALVDVPLDSARRFLNTVFTKSSDNSQKMVAAVTLARNHLNELQTTRLLPLQDVNRHRKAVDDLSFELHKLSKDNEEFSRISKIVKSMLAANPVGGVPKQTSGVDNDGTKFSLDDYKGKVVVLDFFANWCPHCKTMYPHSRQMVEEYADDPFVMVGVHCESQKILEELKENDVVTWRCFADGESGPINSGWGVESYPTVYLIDANWRIRRVYNGNPGEGLQFDVDSLIYEMKYLDQQPTKIREADAKLINRVVWRKVIIPDDTGFNSADLQLLNKVVKEYPKGIYQNTLSVAKFRDGDYKGAIEAALKSIELTPKERGWKSPYAGDYAIIAMSNFRLGEQQQATKYRNKFESAMDDDEFKKNPDCLSLKRELVRLFKEQGN